MKKVFSLIIAVIMALSIVPAMAEEASSHVLLNGEKAAFEILNGYVPVRAFADSLGIAVKWDNDNRYVVVNDGGTEVIVPIGKKWVQRAGLKQSVDKESIIINDLSYMPLDALKGFNATYGGDESLVTIEKSVFEEFRRIEKEILDKNECFSLKNLAISGKDLISKGFEPGPEMGKILENLLEKVMDGEIPNEKEKLLAFINMYK